MRPRPGRTSPGTYQGFMGCRPVGRARQNASHTARSCFGWPKHFQRVTYLLAYGWAYCKLVFSDHKPIGEVAELKADVGVRKIAKQGRLSARRNHHRPGGSGSRAAAWAS